MTVAELIEKLKEFDPELPVMVEDNEYGPGDVSQVDLSPPSMGSPYVEIY